MGTRFHQLGLNTFNAIIPGELPSDKDREKFLKPDIGDETMSEHEIGVELTKTIKSILDAAGDNHALEVLHTPYHKARGDHGKPQDTFNNVGIYPTTEMARCVTRITERDVSTRSTSHLMAGSFGRRLWYSLAILREVKHFKNTVCAFTMIPRSLQPPEAEAAPSETSNVDPLGPASPRQVTSPSVDVEHGTGAAGTAVKYTSVACPEVKVGDPYINNTLDGELGLGQVVDYMRNLLTHQHRCFAYGFYVKWKYARLLYFDRTGALISEPFDWTESTSLLHDFIWKVAHMTPEQLGYDPTAQLASESELDLLRSKMGAELKSLPAEVQEYVLKAFPCKATQPEATTDAADSGTAQAEDKPVKATQEVPFPLDEIPIHKLTVTSSNPSRDEAFPEPPVPSQAGSSTSPALSNGTAGEHAFLVGRPHFAADSLIGRCTRGYIAFDLQAKAFCFLKDSWRPLVLGRSRPEHLVYERLRDYDVGDIASLVCGGDVGGHQAQVTRVQDNMPPENKPVPRVHYRIVVKEIGVPLTEFKTFTELAGIFRCVVGAHMAAYHFAGILHHDISIGNILINPATRFGFLIDWDVSQLASELGQGPMEPDCTGTWPFRSALSLRYPRKPYRLSDDIESFIHVFRYLVLRFHPTDLQDLCTHVQTYFEHSSKVGNFRLGGQPKLDYFDSTVSSFEVVENDKLQALLNDIASRCYHEFYKLVDKNLMQRKYGIQAGVARGSKPTPAGQARPAPLSANGRALMNMFRHMSSAPSSSPNPPALQVDACDIACGFLSHQFHLMQLFDGFRGVEGDKHEDQFPMEEPTPLPSHAPARGGISNMSQSRSQTQDGVNRPTTVAAPSSAPTPAPLSPQAPFLDVGFTSASASTDDPSGSAPSTSTRILRKRKQEDRDGKGGEAAVANSNSDDNGELGPSSPKQKQKRQRKARS